MVWDEAEQKWLPRYGYGRANNPKDTARDWLVVAKPGDDGSVARSCGRLADPIGVGNGETLLRLRLRPGWRIVARRGRLHCEAPEGS